MQKKVYLEVLRIFAIILVVYNHTRLLGFELYKVTDNTVTYYASMTCSIVCKCAVPLFLMISGAVLLGKEESFKELFKKRILHILIILVIFVFLQYLRLVRVNGWSTFSLKAYFTYLVCGGVIETYWYLYLYLGYLFCLPILRLIAQSMKIQHMRYLLFLEAGMVCLGLIQMLSGYGVNISFAVLADVIVYPLLGYALSKFDVKNTVPRCLLFIFVTILASVVLLDMGLKTGAYNETSVFGVSTVPLTIILFLLAKGIFKNNEKTVANKAICLIAGGTFGTYLIEDPIRNQFEWICGSIDRTEPHLLTCWLFVLISTVVSIALILVVNKILKVMKIPFSI